MAPELGLFALSLALMVALAMGIVPIAGAHFRHAPSMALGRSFAIAQFLLVAFAFGCLAYSFVTNDFSVQNVAQNSNTRLPLEYRVAATWGSHEGSMLLWTLMLAGWTFAVATAGRNLPPALMARVVGVMGLVSAGFLLFMLLTSSPFLRLFPAAAEGKDLNPLLQDPGMVFHPPLLYMGYVGFSVVFAFAIAALISGRMDVAWARWCRPWTTVAWAFLTCGIALGSWWAYYELGWGGWWFWDPVENASFMPWLVGTALIHSLVVTEKRGLFKSWTVLLAIIAFSLSLLGTFLVRSGVLTSVHAFATDPARGVFILIFLAIVIGGSLTLFAWRASSVQNDGEFTPVSRESMLLANNVLLLVAMLAVLLGTLYPLFLDAMAMGKISVGPPYFDAVFLPLMAPAIFLMGIGPITRWRKAELPDLATRLRWAFAVAVVVATVLPFVMGKWTPLIGLGLLMAFWVVGSTAVGFRQRLASQPQRGLRAKLAANSRSWYGMHLAHLGVAMFIIGVTMVRGYEVERDVRLDVGQSVSVGGYDFKFGGVREAPGPNYRAMIGTVEVFADGKLVRTMKPEKRVYTASEMPMTEAAISTGLLRDVYVSLGDPVSDRGVGGAWAVRVYVKPFIDWIWMGAFLMALGGFFAASDRRYRLASRRVAQLDATTATSAATAANG